ncbi:ABC transporter permease [Cytobacillus oceanisediminis]|uniref:ABC transporter permease n=1 Tax=Niallia alba TaxID=2729105 RepID=A0A7Y0KAH0_9BACI|nr:MULTISPECIES: ABC transporter permease [Bacillaceae]MBZ9533589.1 ABC transporter permease [Cytobacillus oceanisediminis]NMO78685.1 ABC transporter permease [Niallia alba]
MKRIIRNQLIIGFISVSLFWYIVYFLLQSHTIPSPFLTVIYMWNEKYMLLLHAGASLLRIIIALFISLLIGVPLGIILGKNKRINTLLSPFLYYIYPIPKVAFLPIFMILYGLGNQSKITLIIWIIVFQIILSVRDGVLQIPSSYYKVMEGFQAPIYQQLIYLIFPSVLPAIFTGIRISIGISLATLFFAENYATTYGIGYYIISAWTKMNYEEMFAGIVTLGCIGLLLFILLDKLELKVTPWNHK